MDLAVVEAGMGGRFDATSLLGDVLAAGIPPLGLDHQEYLGDTLAAIDKYGVAEQISYISTGGGAFLEFVEGKVLPAVAVLESRA